ncbi:MAG TPA: hypothetical protein DEP72_00345 [Clostridiales bacterium]|nr:MAG: hypothetical protein A2Y18_00930 [Clostridiales bacterium GWD2_32_19]HCC06600.1 hypothetical protein [Clostridiales bacterium]
MNLSARLLSIANKVNQSSNIIDIGTDHGYVPIYLCEKNVIQKAVASDVSKSSCDKASKNILEHSQDTRISVIKSDGLNSIDTMGFDTVVISGMGGKLIGKIVDDSVDKFSNIEYLIVQPQTDVEYVRRKLHDVGYKITDEDIVLEDEIYYNIIVGKKGNEIYEKEIEYLFGKVLIDRKDKMLKSLLEYEIIKSRDIIKLLNESKTENAMNRINNINKYIILLDETINSILIKEGLDECFM